MPTVCCFKFSGGTTLSANKHYLAIKILSREVTPIAYSLADRYIADGNQLGLQCIHDFMIDDARGTNQLKSRCAFQSLVRIIQTPSPRIPPTQSTTLLRSHGTRGTPASARLRVSPSCPGRSRELPVRAVFVRR